MINILKQFVRFCNVGVINTVTSLAVIFALSEIIQIHYMLANLCGYTAGVLIGFFLHKTITFKDTSKKAKTQFAKFFAIFIASYCVQLLALWLMVSELNIDNFPSQVLAVGFYTILNFIGNRAFTFNDKKETIS